MKIEEFRDTIPEPVFNILKKNGVNELRPCQEKVLKKNLFSKSKNFLIATPTASGKTLIAEMVMLNTILVNSMKVIYIVPLKALATEKYKEFINLYGKLFRIRLSIGEIQTEEYNYDYDLLIVTSEKLDSLIRHDLSILDGLGAIIVDEIHLLNDEARGPTLEILLTIFKTKFKKIKILGLSATISNSKELAEWLNAELIKDDWRPVRLKHKVLYKNKLYCFK